MQRGRGRKILKISLIAALILIILAGAYFGAGVYKNWRAERNLYIFEQGTAYGYTGAVLQIINISDSCQPFPVYAGNETRELISVTCYK